MHLLSCATFIINILGFMCNTNELTQNFNHANSLFGAWRSIPADLMHILYSAPTAMCCCTKKSQLIFNFPPKTE